MRVTSQVAQESSCPRVILPESHLARSHVTQNLSQVA